MSENSQYMQADMDTHGYQDSNISCPVSFLYQKLILSLEIENDCITWLSNSLAISYSTDSILV